MHPVKGVKHGCPLSPHLFSLFISDFDQHTPSLVDGISLHGQAMCVSHMFYVDDLCLALQREAGLQSMLDDLARYSEMQGLTVNAGKSKVVCFNTKGDQARTDIRYGKATLDVESQFKYLDMIFDRDGNMSHADRQWARALMGAIQRVAVMTREHGEGGGGTVECLPWLTVGLFLMFTYVVLAIDAFTPPATDICTPAASSQFHYALLFPSHNSLTALDH
jgi:hypothetical protein